VAWLRTAAKLASAGTCRASFAARAATAGSRGPCHRHSTLGILPRPVARPRWTGGDAPCSWRRCLLVCSRRASSCLACRRELAGLSALLPPAVFCGVRSGALATTKDGVDGDSRALVNRIWPDHLPSSDIALPQTSWGRSGQGSDAAQRARHRRPPLLRRPLAAAAARWVRAPVAIKSVTQCADFEAGRGLVVGPGSAPGGLLYECGVPRPQACASFQAGPSGWYKEVCYNLKDPARGAASGLSGERGACWPCQTSKR
jgi:hypothetical protein